METSTKTDEFYRSLEGKCLFSTNVDNVFVKYLQSINLLT